MVVHVQLSRFQRVVESYMDFFSPPRWSCGNTKIAQFKKVIKTVQNQYLSSEVPGEGFRISLCLGGRLPANMSHLCLDISTEILKFVKQTKKIWWHHLSKRLSSVFHPDFQQIWVLIKAKANNTTFWLHVRVWSRRFCSITLQICCAHKMSNRPCKCVCKVISQPFLWLKYFNLYN